VSDTPRDGYCSLKVSNISVNVHLPKDRISMAHQGYGFAEFLTEEDAEYACKIMNQIKLWGKPIRVNKVRRKVHIPRHFWFLRHQQYSGSSCIFS